MESEAFEIFSRASYCMPVGDSFSFFFFSFYDSQAAGQVSPESGTILSRRPKPFFARFESSNSYKGLERRSNRERLEFTKLITILRISMTRKNKNEIVCGETAQTKARKKNQSNRGIPRLIWKKTKLVATPRRLGLILMASSNNNWSSPFFFNPASNFFP